MEKFVIYRRVSTKRQGDSGLGLEAQDRDIQIFLESYAEVPFEVLGTFTDVESGSKADRAQLREAMDLARREGASLLVSKLDRISRSVAFIAGLLEDKRLGLRVASMPYADKFQLHIYAALAEQEREFISRRTKAALAEAKARGTILGGLREGTAQRNAAARAKADEFAAKVMPTIQTRKAAGASLAAIADELNALGVATARGGKWHPSTVRNVLAR
ncbi:MAG: recombinase family protein [Rhodobacteraceae bacterium]|nr:recombinase family protein [Paracoccaceae bacterium]